MAELYTKTMSRNEEESRRLTNLFSLMTRNMGYTIHPDLEPELASKPLVMDLATGNSVFLRHLALSHPDGVFHGTDISTDLFPPSDTLPGNITLSTLDVKKPIPVELQGKYDFVHVRLLHAAMLPSDWVSVIQNVSALLKPGGVIQWEECDFKRLQVLRDRPDSTVDAARYMGDLFKKAMREQYEHGGEALGEAMKTAGISEVKTDIVASDRLPETRREVTTNLMGPVFSWAKKMASISAPDFPSLDAMEESCRQAQGDIESGCYLRFDIYIVRGRRG